MGLANAIAHTCIGVSDLGRALDFWVGGLGLTEVRRTQMATGATLVLLKAPTGGEELIELFWRPELESPAAQGGALAVASPLVGQRHIAFWVADVRAAVQALESRGVPIARRPPEPGMPGGMLAFVKDPDGTDVELMQVI